MALARDDPEEALRGTALALAVPQIDIDGPAVLWWRPAQVWALIRAGDLTQAEVTLAALESRIGQSEHSTLIHAAWLRGSLAMARGDLRQADQVLQAGLARLPQPADALLPRAAGT